MYNGILETKIHLQNPIWGGKDVMSILKMLSYFTATANNIERANTVEIAPAEREYRCRWERCYKHFCNHLREHTGYAKDELMEVLLKDHALALNTPAKQMRWHSLVIQWCLKMYCKSHSL